MGETTIRRNYKDHLFRMIFREKKELLSLYNALNGTDYTEEQELEINTIEDVIYMGFHNDSSFLLDARLNLYEAQSSWNPNMALRGVFYFARLYEGYVAQRELDVYSSVRLPIPTPKYIVFYYGEEKKPGRTEQKLSDSFIKKDEDSALECRATVINIGGGCNPALLEGCRKLKEYVIFIEEIRKRIHQGMKLERAVNVAVDACIRDGILADFLKKHRAEVLRVILTEYDEELHIRSEKELSFQEGNRQGIEWGLARGRLEGLIGVICRKLRKGKSPEQIAEELEEDLQEISGLIAVAQKSAPEYDVEKICELYGTD